MANDLPHWHVDGAAVRQETTLAPSGSGLVTHWVVPYVIDDGPARGTTHQVTIDPREFNQATVKQAITEALNSVHGVASLNSHDA